MVVALSRRTEFLISIKDGRMYGEAALDEKDLYIERFSNNLCISSYGKSMAKHLDTVSSTGANALTRKQA